MPPGKQQKIRPIRHWRESTDSVPAPKTPTLLVPIPSELVVLAPSALPHIIVIGTSRWTFALLAVPFLLAFPPCLCPSAGLCLLDLCHKDHLQQASPSWARTVHGVDGHVQEVTPMPKHEVGEPPGPLQQSHGWFFTVSLTLCETRWSQPRYLSMSILEAIRLHPLGMFSLGTDILKPST